ncbi:hypothetical protein Agub_g3414, partial [Astrephomene gubernaculifera]
CHSFWLLAFLALLRTSAGLPKRFTVLRAWLWAASTLHSRTMYLPWCPAGALTPYGDLHNYQPPPPPYTPQLGGVAMAAAAPGVTAVVARNAGNTTGAVVGAAAANDTGAATGGHVSAGAPSATSNAPVAFAAVADAAPNAGEAASTPGVDTSGASVCHNAHVQADVSGCEACDRSRDARTTAVGTGGADPAAAADVAYGGELAPEPCQNGSQKEVTLQAESASAASNACGGDGGDMDADAASGAIAGDGVWDAAAQQYCILVRRPYRRGEQVMLCYGRHTNLELLEHYGFVLQDNPHDTALLDAALLPLPSAALASPGAPHLPSCDCFLHA